MKIRVLQHIRWIDGGEYISWAKKHHHELMFIKVFNFEELPTEIDADMLLILGGPQNPASTKEEFPFYDTAKERAFIKMYIDANKLVIGSCLGAQLIGESLGAKYFHSPYSEVGLVKGELTLEGKKDKYLSHFPDSLLIGEWHNDMPGLTSEAKVLMKSEGCPHQIIRYKEFVYGFQTHMEFKGESFLKGIKYSGESFTRGGPYIHSEEELLSYDTSEMNEMLSIFLDKISKDYLNK